MLSKTCQNFCGVFILTDFFFLSSHFLNLTIETVSTVSIIGLFVCLFFFLSVVHWVKCNDKDYFFTHDIASCVYTAEEAASNATKTYLQALNTNVGVR